MFDRQKQPYPISSASLPDSRSGEATVDRDPRCPGLGSWISVKMSIFFPQKKKCIPFHPCRRVFEPLCRVERSCAINGHAIRIGAASRRLRRHAHLRAGGPGHAHLRAVARFTRYHRPEKESVPPPPTPDALAEHRAARRFRGTIVTPRATRKSHGRRRTGGSSAPRRAPSLQTHGRRRTKCAPLVVVTDRLDRSIASHGARPRSRWQSARQGLMKRRRPGVAMGEPSLEAAAGAR